MPFIEWSASCSFIFSSFFGSVLYVVSCYSVFLLLPSVVSFSRRRILMVIETIHNFSIRPFTKNIDISIDNRVDPNSIGSVKLKWYTYTQQPNTICRGLASLHSITQHRKFISYFDSECYKFYKMICDKRARSRERGEQLFFSVCWVRLPYAVLAKQKHKLLDIIHSLSFKVKAINIVYCLWFQHI